MVEVALDLVDGILHGFRLGAFLEGRRQQGDGELSECLVGLGLHVIGDDSHRVMVLRIFLFQERFDSVGDDRIFLIGREEDQKSVHTTTKRGRMDGQQVFFVVEEGDESEEYHICDRP